MTEQELTEKIQQAIGQYSATVMVENPTCVFDPTPAIRLSEQILALIKQVLCHFRIISSLKAGYFQEEADLVGRLLDRGWIPPAEAKNYVKLADDQSLPINPWKPSGSLDIQARYFEYSKSQQDMLKAGWRKVELDEKDNLSEKEERIEVKDKPEPLSRLLTDEEFVDCQVKFIEENRRKTGVTWSFPLWGELREICNRQAQDAKTHQAIREEVREWLHAYTSGDFHYDKIVAQLVQAYEKEFGALRGEMLMEVE